jgi:tetratricopeptide (TPR) repeat protein
MQNPSLRIAACILAVALPSTLFAAGSGVGGSVGGVEAPQRTPEQMAASSYRAALKNKERALSYEAKAAGIADPKKRTRELERARKQWQSAVANHQKAIQQDAGLYQALNELGFAYRRLGDYENALRAYDRALALKPGFAPAIEYRAEALLAMDRFEETRAAYLELYRVDQDHAALLMQAFDAWLATLSADAPVGAQEFARWVRERKQLAEVTQVRPGRLDRTW